MALPPAELPEPTEVHLRFLRTLPLAVRELEGTVTRLIDSSWDEAVRRQAHHMASSLAEATAAAGLSRVASVTQGIASLLKLGLEEVFSIRDQVRGNLQEQLATLKELCKGSGESIQA